MALTLVSVKLPDEIIERLDRVANASAESDPGVQGSRSRAVRQALALGLAALELKLGLGAPPKEKKTARKPKT